MILAVKKLMKRYGDTSVLNQLDLEVKKGEIYGVLGTTGCGKTTLLYCILGLLAYDRGSVKLFQEKIVVMQKEIKRKIGVLFEKNAVFETLTVYDNIYYFAKLYRKDKRKAIHEVEEVLTLLDLHQNRNTLFMNLDEGNQKLCNFACAIVHHPEVIFVDGGVANCVPQIKNRIYHVLSKLRNEGKTILLFTSYINEVEEICDRIAIMDKGKIIAQGTKEELKRNISLGERSRIHVYHITEEQINQIRLIPGVFYVEYANELLTVKSKRGRNNLLHILHYFQEKEIAIGEIVSELPTLDDVYWEMTGKSFVKNKSKKGLH